MCLLFSYQALILEVCDETDVAELKLKVNSYILLNIPIILGTLVLWLNGLKMPWIMENECKNFRRRIKMVEELNMLLRDFKPIKERK